MHYRHYIYHYYKIVTVLDGYAYGAFSRLRGSWVEVHTGGTHGVRYRNVSNSQDYQRLILDDKVGLQFTKVSPEPLHEDQA
ncbi:hypothetical protein Pcinc_030918 [Petrolisthes cinctipes]|uniref:Uncharacterized protein n=1 Tax=Petrolisthes cinctipes TaxID=88211 RepID=A0AAE1EXS6_PETCI|nr:hypothetical protein Pcinc_030918 [Petrolisthes cinctipes]